MAVLDFVGQPTHHVRVAAHLPSIITGDLPKGWTNFMAVDRMTEKTTAPSRQIFSGWDSLCRHCCCEYHPRYRPPPLSLHRAPPASIAWMAIKPGRYPIGNSNVALHQPGRTRLPPEPGRNAGRGPASGKPQRLAIIKLGIHLEMKVLAGQFKNH